MLQQEKPDDFVIATGKTCQLKEFVRLVFECVNLNWEDHVRYKTDLLRPTDIMISRADPRKAWSKLGWSATYKIEEVARLMVDAEILRSSGVAGLADF